jgi:hypothetical protein
LLLGLAMVRDHALRKLFDLVILGFLQRQLAQRNLHHASQSRLAHELLRGQRHAGD